MGLQVARALEESAVPFDPTVRVYRRFHRQGQILGPDRTAALDGGYRPPMTPPNSWPDAGRFRRRIYSENRGEAVADSRGQGRPALPRAGVTLVTLVTWIAVSPYRGI